MLNNPDTVYVGNRYLLRVGERPKFANVGEYIVVEIAPNTKMVKIKNLINGNVGWVYNTSIELVEQLTYKDFS